MARDGTERDLQTDSGERQQETMELLSGETRHGVIMSILGHPDHLVSQTELDEMLSKSPGAIDDALDRLEAEGIIAQYSTENPDNPNERDYPTTFWGPTEQGIRTLHEYNYLRLVPAQRALYDNTTHSDTANRHLQADRPQLPPDIEEALSFDEPRTAEREAPNVNEQREREAEPLFADAQTTSEDGERDNTDSSSGDTGLAGIVDEALAATQTEDVSADHIEDVEDPTIAIVGCGGAGNNTVNRIHRLGVEGLDTIAVNTDKQHLQMIEADTKVLVGKSLTEGLGAGGEPSVGARAVEMARGTLGQILSETDLVFVTAGMGGGTGTGGAPIVSKIAKEQGNTVVGIVSTPFNVERARTAKAEEGLQRMREEADSVLVLDNNRLLEYVPNLPIGKVFSVMDQIIAETVMGLSETITQPSLTNIDYADVVSAVDRGGLGIVFVGESQTPSDPDAVVKDALSYPLLDVDYQGATHVLVQISGGPELSQRDAEAIAGTVAERLDGNPSIAWGARSRDGYRGKVRLSVIMTGIDGSQILGPAPSDAPGRSAPDSPGHKEGLDIIVDGSDSAGQPQIEDPFEPGLEEI